MKFPPSRNLPFHGPQNHEQFRANQAFVRDMFSSAIYSNTVHVSGRENVPDVATGFFDAGRHIANQDHFFKLGALLKIRPELLFVIAGKNTLHRVIPGLMEDLYVQPVIRSTPFNSWRSEATKLAQRTRRSEEFAQALAGIGIIDEKPMTEPNTCGVIYPEGHRTPFLKPNDFHAGVIWDAIELYKLTGISVPIMADGIAYTEDTRKGIWLPKQDTEFAVHFGDSLEVGADFTIKAFAKTKVREAQGNLYHLVGSAENEARISIGQDRIEHEPFSLVA